jgi:hypothetical protein
VKRFLRYLMYVPSLMFAVFWAYLLVYSASEALDGGDWITPLSLFVLISIGMSVLVILGRVVQILSVLVSSSNLTSSALLNLLEGYNSKPPTSTLLQREDLN